MIQSVGSEFTGNLGEVPRLNKFFSAALDSDNNYKHMNLAGWLMWKMYLPQLREKGRSKTFLWSSHKARYLTTQIPGGTIPWNRQIESKGFNKSTSKEVRNIKCSICKWEGWKSNLSSCHPQPCAREEAKTGQGCETWEMQDYPIWDCFYFYLTFLCY